MKKPSGHPIRLIGCPEFSLQLSKNIFKNLLTNLSRYDIILPLRTKVQLGGIAQLGERLNGIQEVSGSIPLISTIVEPVEPNGLAGFSLCSKVCGIDDMPVCDRYPSSGMQTEIPTDLFSEVVGIIGSVLFLWRVWMRTNVQAASIAGIFCFCSDRRSRRAACTPSGAQSDARVGSIPCGARTAVSTENTFVRAWCIRYIPPDKS